MRNTRFVVFMALVIASVTACEDDTIGNRSVQWTECRGLKGQTYCLGNTIVSCDMNSSIERETPCADGLICVDSNAGAACKCTADANKCTNGVAVTCNTSTGQFEEVKCSSGECNGNACKTNECEDGDTKCEADTDGSAKVSKCQNGKWAESDVDCANKVCDSDNKTCIENTCEYTKADGTAVQIKDGQAVCDGNVVVSCDNFAITKNGECMVGTCVEDSTNGTASCVSRGCNVGSDTLNDGDSICLNGKKVTCHDGQTDGENGEGVDCTTGWICADGENDCRLAKDCTDPVLGHLQVICDNNHDVVECYDGQFRMVEDCDYENADETLRTICSSQNKCESIHADDCMLGDTLVKNGDDVCDDNVLRHCDVKVLSEGDECADPAPVCDVNLCRAYKQCNIGTSEEPYDIEHNAFACLSDGLQKAICNDGTLVTLDADNADACVAHQLCQYDGEDAICVCDTVNHWVGDGNGACTCENGWGSDKCDCDLSLYHYDSIAGCVANCTANVCDNDVWKKCELATGIFTEQSKPADGLFICDITNGWVEVECFDVNDCGTLPAHADQWVCTPDQVCTIDKCSDGYAPDGKQCVCGNGKVVDKDGLCIDKCTANVCTTDHKIRKCLASGLLDDATDCGNDGNFKQICSTSDGSICVHNGCKDGYHDENGTCVINCTDADNDCVDTTTGCSVTVCDATSHIKTTTDYSVSCKLGAEAGDCLNGAVKCSENASNEGSIYTCASGQWGATPTKSCEMAGVKLGCDISGTACADMSKDYCIENGTAYAKNSVRCDAAGELVQTCMGNNTWADGTACKFGCDKGACKEPVGCTDAVTGDLIKHEAFGCASASSYGTCYNGTFLTTGDDGYNCDSTRPYCKNGSDGCVECLTDANCASGDVLAVCKNNTCKFIRASLYEVEMDGNDGLATVTYELETGLSISDARILIVSENDGLATPVSSWTDITNDFSNIANTLNLSFDASELDNGSYYAVAVITIEGKHYIVSTGDSLMPIALESTTTVTSDEAYRFTLECSNDAQSCNELQPLICVDRKWTNKGDSCTAPKHGSVSCSISDSISGCAITCDSNAVKVGDTCKLKDGEVCENNDDCQHALCDKFVPESENKTCMLAGEMIVNAIPIELTPGSTPDDPLTASVEGDTTSYRRDLTVITPDEIGNIYTSEGRDIFYAVEVPEGKTLSVDLTMLEGADDFSLFFLTDSGTDVEGNGALAAIDTLNNPEHLDYRNNTGAMQTVYIGISGFAIGPDYYGPYTLAISVANLCGNGRFDVGEDCDGILHCSDTCHSEEGYVCRNNICKIGLGQNCTLDDDCYDSYVCDRNTYKCSLPD